MLLEERHPPVDERAERVGRQARDQGGAAAGVADAAAGALGSKAGREVAGFEEALPALGSGRHRAGTGDAGVTGERRVAPDFVSHTNDGQGFAVREDSTPEKVTTLSRPRGPHVATGTTSEVALEENRPRRAERAGSRTRCGPTPNRAPCGARSRRAAATS
ncbi:MULTISPECIES: type 2 periplasmic-binding domain-containing protein [Streptomyces diastaticus group]|uniref:Uncharacterized protein n=1 Tax=Streptomyces rutgersensis TaxID=53451 RepID=A0ABX6RJE3_9ACTN|nr:hypothetical protein F0345_04780 [Streptomyces rutgersensis]